MKAKLILFTSGLVVAGGGFWLYQQMTGAKFGLDKGAPAVFTEEELARPMTVESLTKLGDEPEYKVSAQKAEQVKGQPGHYKVTGVRAEYFLGGGRKMVVEADIGELDVVTSGKKSAQKYSIRRGKLSGDVTLTEGPRDTFIDPGEVRKSPVREGQFRAIIRDGNSAATQAAGTQPAGESARGVLHFDPAAREMTTTDRVAIRGPSLSLDGEDLAVTLSPDGRKVNHMRLLRGDTIVIKPDADGNFTLGSASSGAATQGATTRVATSRPGKKSVPQAYELVFTDNVAVKQGAGVLKCDRMTTRFMRGGPDGPDKGAGGTTRVAGTHPSTKKGDEGGFGFTPLDVVGEGAKGAKPQEIVITWSGPLELIPMDADKSGLASGKDIRFEAAGTQKAVELSSGDQSIKTGSLTYQRAEDTFVLDAGIAGAVVMSDGVRAITAGRVAYNRGTNHAVLEPGPLKAVLMADGPRVIAAGRVEYDRVLEKAVLVAGTLKAVEMEDRGAENPLGKMACAKLTYDRLNGRLDFVGPGQLEFPRTSLGRDALQPGAAAATAPAAGAREMLVTTFSDAMAIELGSIASARDPRKTVQFIKHAVLTGDINVADSTFVMRADRKLDLTLAHAATEKDAKAGKPGEIRMQQALETLVAEGNVDIRAARAGLTVAEADKPDTLAATTLEIHTVPVAGKSPRVDKMVAKGSVVAVMHQTEKDGAGKPAKLMAQKIETPELTVLLEQKEKKAGAAAAGDPGRGGLNARKLTATGGVTVTMDGYASAGLGGDGKIVATCNTLEAVPKGAGEAAGKATLTGLMKGADIVSRARLQLGDDFIEGYELVLNQEAKSIAIPGAGTFAFVDKSEKDRPVPVEITWKERMDFDQKANEAKFKGDVKTAVTGKTTEKSQLTCNALTVALLTADQRKAATTRPGGTPLVGPAATTGPKDRAAGLREIKAVGNVVALGETFDPAGKLLTRQRLTARELDYVGATKTLSIPGQGDLTMEDFRPAEKNVSKKDAALGGDTRGLSGIRWEGSLTYAGDTGIIEARKNVTLAHVPLEAFATPASRPATRPGATPRRDGKAKLDTQTLIARIETSRDKKAAVNASPMALGDSGQVKIVQFVARDGAVLDVDDQKLVGNTLTFDPTTNIAIAEGNVAITSGEMGFVTTDWAKWDLTKNANAFEVRKVRMQGGQ